MPPVKFEWNGPNGVEWVNAPLNYKPQGLGAVKKVEQAQGLKLNYAQLMKRHQDEIERRAREENDRENAAQLFGDAVQLFREDGPLEPLPPREVAEARAAWLVNREKEKPMIEVQEGPVGFRMISERSTRLPRFKLQYASEDECRMRLEGTLVTIQDNMVMIQKVLHVKQDGEIGLGCIAMDQDGKKWSLLFSQEGLNLRSPEPGYIQIGSEAYSYHRMPARVYKQGINSENTYFAKVGRPEQRQGLFGHFPNNTLLKAFNDRPIHQFEGKIPEGFMSCRLSDRIAVYKKNGGKLYVEHKGHHLGILKNNKVFVEHNSPWVQKSLEAVGLQAVEQG